MQDAVEINTKKVGCETLHLQQDDAQWADMYGSFLQFARSQLGDEHEAEDVVQEALVAAIKGAGQFQGRSAIKTWAFAILRNKIADQLRSRYKGKAPLESSLEAGHDYEHQLYTDKGRWQQDFKPSHWGEPEAHIHQSQFWRVFEACFTDLSPKQARVFMMREFVGLSIAEITQVTEQSASSIHVLMFRARLRLQQCLELLWFNTKEAPHAQL